MYPKMAEGQFVIGVTLNFEERFFESLQFYKKALDLDAENGDFWFAMADAYYKLGQIEKSIESYDKVVEYNPLDIEAWLDYSTVLYEQGRLTEASEIISEGIKNNPDAAELYYRMVAYLFALHQPEEGFVYLETALSISPEKHDILFEYLPQLQENGMILDIISRYIK